MTRPIPAAAAAAAAAAPRSPAGAGPVEVALDVNGQHHVLDIEPRVTLLDALRERLHLTGTKKGCDRGQCGACTVLVDGRRVNACLTLAIMQEGRDIRTIEGLGSAAALHPMQRAFLEHDGLQCGYCTPGQICSAVAVVEEMRAGAASFVTAALDERVGSPIAPSAAEVAERMSGNLCRCGAYSNIVAAVLEVATGAAGRA